MSKFLKCLCAGIIIVGGCMVTYNLLAHKNSEQEEAGA